MAIKLGQIVVELLADTAGFISGMDKATQQSKKVTKEIHSSFSEMGSKVSGATQGALSSLGQFGTICGEVAHTAAEAFAGIGESSNLISASVTALGGLAVAALAAAAGFIELGKAGGELVEHLSQVSQKTGIGIRDLQVFEAAGKTVGVSLDDMVIGMRKFSQSITGFGKGAAAQSILRELGVTSHDTREALLQTADAFAKMEDGPRKASDAIALFGKSGLTLIPVLNKGRDGISQFEGFVDSYGPKIGKEAVEANEKYRVSVEKLSLQWDKFKVGVEQDVLPNLSKLAAAFDADKIRTFLKVGPLGYSAAIAQLQAQNAKATEQAKLESAAKAELVKKQEELSASVERTFNIQKAGGTAAFALEQARQNMNDDIQAGLWKQASAIQSQLPSLEKAAALEAQRAAEAKRVAASYAAIVKSFADGSFNVKPVLKNKAADPTAGIEALFGKQPAKDPLAGAPDFGNLIPGTDFSKSTDMLKDNLNIGQQALDDFYSKWSRNSKGTVDSINADYDAQLAHFQGLLALGEISAAQATDVYLKLEQQRMDGLKRLRQENGTSTFQDAWQDVFTQIEASGKDFARSITQDIGGAINALTDEMTKFITTGKGLNIKQIGQQLESNLASSLLKKGESSLFGSLGGLFGLNPTKPDGSTQQAALWVQMATGLPGLSPAGSGLGNLPLGGLGSIASFFGGSSSPASLIPASGGGLGGLFSGGGFMNLLSSFLPFLADGGDVTPGRAYVVGEKQPELFVPRSAGTVVPSVPSGGTVQHISVTQNISTPDADSFRKSSGQIASQMNSSLQRGAMRLGR